MSSQLQAWRRSTAAGIPQPRFRPDLEGLRALAILLVVAYHAKVPGFSGGYVGVDVFFVLSGYLITWLLHHELATTGSIDLRSFYARRARRLLPPVVALIALTTAASALIYAPWEQRALANSAVSAAVYLSNAYFAYTSTDYLGLGQELDPLLHMWSLSVEEQFYLGWPLLLLFAAGALKWQRRGGHGRLLMWLAAAGAVSLAISVWLTEVRQPLAFFLSPARAWEFAAGGLAVLIPGRPEDLDIQGSRGKLTELWPALGVVALGGCAVLYDHSTPFPGVAAIVPVLATILLLRAGSGGSPPFVSRALSWRPFQEIGRLSYSWYLWHWPLIVLAVAVNGNLGWPARLLVAAAALAVAEGSFRLVENPVRRHPGLVGRPGRTLVLAFAMTASCAAIGASWRGAAIVWQSRPDQAAIQKVRTALPRIYADGCDRWFYSSTLEECSYGAADAERLAVLIGDSRAGQWFPALAPLTADGWRLIVLTKSACPMVDSVFVYPRIGRRYVECERWREQALVRVSELRPNLTVISSSSHYPLDEATWFSGLRTVVDPLAEASDRVVLIADTQKPPFDPAACAARLAWRPDWIGGAGCSQSTWPRRVTTLDAASAAAAELYDNVSVLDLNGTYCSPTECSARHGDGLVFRDDGHLAVTFVRSLGPDVRRAVRGPTEG